ncbi:UNVERIFIED_CONTAM: hypothetical protein PYX00_010372 [Menopon gallinae]|uniref:Pericentriolar material 1 protein C-terminal domain-containing protein n=1 Tax=Menopon gallinae TaxID=328185 RepID=A0AAW2HF69_9NEOP
MVFNILINFQAQLSQIQKLMANISADSSVKDDLSTPTELIEDRGMQQRPRSEPEPEGSNNAAKLEQAKVKLNQLTQLLEFAQSAQGAKGVTPNFIQMASSLSNEEGAVAGRTPSPSLSAKSQTRPCDETYVETMQNMTRELEERTAAMKEEHEKLVQARQELENLARKIPLVKPERSSLSPDDFGSEPPCLINTSLESNGRFVQNEQQSPCNDRSMFACRSVPPKLRQRGVWSMYVPSINPGSHDKKCKNEEMSRSLHGSKNGSRDQARWSPSPTVSFCDNGSCSAIQTQNHAEKAGNMCSRMMNEMLQRSMKSDEITIEELYAQHQILTRTVAQCSQLLWLQQKQIIELRNTLMLQQSAMCQNMCPQPGFSNQPQRNTPLPPNPFQMNTLPNMPFPNQMPIQPQEQNFLSPNQSLKLNSGSMPNTQTTQEFTDQFYQQGTLPFSVPEMHDYQFRYGNCSRSNAPHVNSNLNANQNLNQSGASGLNNRIPVGGISCVGPEDSGALNNQVPPGNRANNYWDNFRSYSRQNLLSHSKSNEDTDTARRTSTTSNQERPLRETSSSIMIQNNAPAGPSAEVSTPSSAYGAADASDFDGLQFPQGATSSALRQNQAQVTRSQSVESQCHRKNESRNHESDSRNVNPKNETGARSRNPETSSDGLRSVRNDVGQPGRNSDNVNSSRNFVQLVRDLDNDEGRSVNNKKRIDKSRSRNEERGNLNNRSNPGIPAALRDNLYSEVTNFITANESRPQFLIQLFRDLQKVTTDPLRQRTLESIQETVNVNNLNERSNINGANLNIIDNRNNIRENRSNLNRNQGDDQSIDNFVCQIRENRQNIGTPGGGGNNLENPNISNIRNLGNSRNNIESEGLRDLRTYFEANLCNFGHNSTLENPNLSNIRENLTRRGAAGTDLDNANPKNLYLSMYDNVWKRNQELISGQNAVFQNCPFPEQGGNDFFQNGARGNNAQCSCNNQSLRQYVCDGTYVENVQHPGCPPPDRDNKYVNVARDGAGNGEDSEADNFSSHARKRSFVESCCASGITPKSGAEDCEEEAGAAAMVPVEWEREQGPENRACLTPVNSRSEVASSGSEACGWCSSAVRQEPLSDNGDLAEADQSRNEESAGAEVSNSFTNVQVPEAEDNCSGPGAEAEEGNFCYGQPRRLEQSVACEGSACDFREVESEASFLFENSTSESEGTYIPLNDDGSCPLRRNMSL